MKDLILLHWMMEDCKKKKSSHKNCICKTDNMPQFEASKLKNNSLK